MADDNQIEEELITPVETDESIEATEVQITENEVVVQGEVAAPQAETTGLTKSMSRRVSRLKKTNTGLDEANQGLKTELDRANAELNLLRMSEQPVMPTMESCDHDEAAFAVQLNDYYSKSSQANVEKMFNDKLIQHQQSSNQAAIVNQNQQGVNAYYKSADSFGVDGFDEAQEIVLNAVGFDMMQSIQAVLGDSGPEVVVKLSKNPAMIEEFNRIVSVQPEKAAFYLGKIAGKVPTVPKSKTTPEPATNIVSGGNGSSAFDARILKMKEKIAKGDASMADLQKLKKEAAG